MIFGLIHIHLALGGVPGNQILAGMGLDLFNFQSLIRTIQSTGVWNVVIELGLIGLFVYSIIRFLRGTRGLRLLKGVGVLLVVLYLIVRIFGSAMNLDRIEFLYSKFLLVASLALAVVFQPEIRWALMRLGETRLFRPLKSQLDMQIDALVESALFLSKRKIGALVAIERQVGVGGIAESGTRLNAELTSALLNTIFWPNSPLHDLGVIVSNGRILYAGVQFPLAEADELEQELGSRHRAAVGMSQETDAVVLVVSEETGDVSVAEGGRLLRKLNSEALRSILEELLGAPGTGSGSDSDSGRYKAAI